MLRQFTYTAIADDCLTLLAHDDSAGGVFRTMLTNRDFVHLGNTSDLDEQAIHLLMENRADNIRTGYEPDECAQKEVFLFGNLCRRETEKIPELANDDEEQALQQDAAIFRVYHARSMSGTGGMTDEMLRQHNMTPEEAVRKTEDFLRIVFKRAIVRTHTFKPGYEDIQTWLRRFFRKQQQYEALLPRYAGAIVRPDPALVVKHLKHPDFYNPEDRLLRMAAVLREQKSPEIGSLAEALNEEPGASVYGQALRNCCRAARIFERKLQSVPTQND